MLFALGKLGASLKLINAKGPFSSLPQLSRTHLPRTCFQTIRPKATDLEGSVFAASPPFYHKDISTRPYTTATMFHQAVQDHHAIASTSPTNMAYKQQSLGNTFNHTGPIQKSATRPLSNGLKHNGVGVGRTPGQLTHGVKRTSSGLAKSLGSQEDLVNYPTLNIVGMEKENDLLSTYHTSSRDNSTNLATVLFDENDFDSDVDLDVEDPATKGTVTYPKLPSFTPAHSRDSGYNSRPQTAFTKAELNSSQPIPWSSSPVEHFKTPQKPASPKTKRAFLPWSQNQKAQSTEEPEDEIESEEETQRPRKRISVVAEKQISTPAPKVTKSQYPWNTTASALKLQQKNFREQSKAQSKVTKGTEDDVKEAIKKKKKNTVHRIFLSEEQQNVLNLVTEYKKSVFFTGSAGKMN